ncbi:MAG: 3-keto-5-aminohexanoate cleavage protein, partial [Nitrososphaeria archaeon]
VTPNISWLNPFVSYPKTPEEFVEEAKKAEKAGASIIHIHAQGMWQEMIRQLRKNTSMISVACPV